MSYEIKYTYWRGIKPFCLFHYNTHKQTYTDCFETDYVFLIGWLEIRISKITYYENRRIKNNNKIKS